MMPQSPIFGFSKEAENLAKTTRESHLHLRNSNVLGIEAVRDELGTVWEECRVPNWDGHEALPVQQDALRNAYLFLESLPLGAPPPLIGAEPDGALTLEWYRSPRHMLSVSVNPESELHYAALFGPNRVYGTEAFFGEVPDRILGLIRQVDPA